MPQPIDFFPHIIPQKYYGFSANQDQPRYGFDVNQSNPHYILGSYYSDVHRPLPPIDFNADLLKTLSEAGEIILILSHLLS